MTIFTSTASGEEIFQRWLENHPEVVKRFEEVKKTTIKEPSSEETQCGDETQDSSSCSEQTTMSDNHDYSTLSS